MTGRDRLLVLHLIDSLGRSGGAEQQLVANLGRMSDPRLRHHVLCLYEPDDTSRAPELPESVGLSVATDGRRGGRLRLARAVDRCVVGLDPDLIHCSLPDAALGARLAGWRRRIPVIESLVNISHEPVRIQDNPAVSRVKLAAHRALDRVTMRRVARFHALSGAVARSWIDTVRLPADRIVVIPRGVEVPPAPTAEERDRTRAGLLAELGVGSSSLMILNVGRQVAQKGQIYALRAMPAILGRFPDTVLVSAGSQGPLTPVLGAEARRLGLERHVRWLGIRSDIPRLMAAADVFVFPSLYEGLGVSLLQALAAGLPCVTTDRPPMTEVVDHEVTGLLAPAGEPAALAAAVVRLGEDAALRVRLGAAGRQRVRDSFDLATTSDAIERMYLDALGLPSLEQ